MLINKNTTIIGQKTILVPYTVEHVQKYCVTVTYATVSKQCCRYHNWMQSEELQKLTASEPLTLDEEYQMQKSWMMDENSKI